MSNHSSMHDQTASLVKALNGEFNRSMQHTVLVNELDTY